MPLRSTLISQECQAERNLAPSQLTLYPGLGAMAPVAPGAPGTSHSSSKVQAPGPVQG
jgi:hypothetical protein